MVNILSFCSMHLWLSILHCLPSCIETLLDGFLPLYYVLWVPPIGQYFMGSFHCTMFCGFLLLDNILWVCPFGPNFFSYMLFLNVRCMCFLVATLHFWFHSSHKCKDQTTEKSNRLLIKNNCQLLPPFLPTNLEVLSRFF